MARGGPYTRMLKSAMTESLDEFIERLAELGKDALEYAYKHKGFEDDTENLRDSYASAVYYNGKLVPSSIRFLGPQNATEGYRKTKLYPSNTGRQAAIDYLNNPKEDVSGAEVVLLCVAAAPYTTFLEKGTYNVAPRRYYGEEIGWRTTEEGERRPKGDRIRVISGASDYISQRWRRLYTRQDLVKVRQVRVIKGSPY